ncbi:MAG: type II toxin-antitoxin system HicA family toxin [Bryobacteraceae bacterium]
MERESHSPPQDSLNSGAWSACADVLRPGSLRQGCRSSAAETWLSTGRVEGSHHMLVKEGHPPTVAVPVHSSKVLPKGTLASIIRISRVGRKRFFAALG